MADTELLPCPFCGGSDAFVERLDYTAAYVQCDADVGDGCACLARGPIAVQDDDGEDIPGGAGAIAAWNRRATPPSPSTAPEVDVRHEFERWMSQRGESAVYIGDGLYSTGAVCDQAEAFAAGVELARAALASRPAEVDDEGLPGLPLPMRKVYERPHGVQELLYYTAEQYRQGQRDAVAADRAWRGAVEETFYPQLFLNWNRSQESPPVAIGKEMGVARKAVELSRAAPSRTTNKEKA